MLNAFNSESSWEGGEQIAPPEFPRVSPVAEKYGPMRRLLRPDDHEFLCRQGLQELAGTVSAQHRRVFRMYVRQLRADINRVLDERREQIARGAWWGLADFYRDSAACEYHLWRLWLASYAHCAAPARAYEMALNALSVLEPHLSGTPAFRAA